MNFQRTIILQSLARGLSCERIAASLKLSKESMDKYLRGIHRDTGIDTTDIKQCQEWFSTRARERLAKKDHKPKVTMLDPMF